jgi:phosphoserine aminotransferase
MKRAFNFCAGPASLPTEVLEQAQQELLDWQGRGVSVMEISHRSAPFLEVAQRSEQRLRTLLDIPDDYAVLFMQGGATSQFSFIPLNLGERYKKAAYIETGHWSAKAIEAARQYLEVEVIASTKQEGFCRAPLQEELVLEGGFDYVHYTPNETIGGVEFDYIPDTQGLPLVADFSSSILSEPLDVSRFDLIYAGAQKNIGPSGLCLVIVKRSWLSQVTPNQALPEVFNYSMVAAQGSMLNTPPTFAWYLSGLVFEWLSQLGGLEVIAKQNALKAEKLYTFIDQSRLYFNPIEHRNRSRMNVPFTLQNADWDSAFLDGAEQYNLLNLKGHRSVGGMRASLYNAVSTEAVDALIDYMKIFEQDRTC